MPIYEYRCQQCGQLTDALQKMSDPPLKTCRHCGVDALEKVMSRTSFHLKGTGWYVTDYKSSGGAPASGSPESSTPTPAPAAPATPAAPAASPAKSDAT